MKTSQRLTFVSVRLFAALCTAAIGFNAHAAMSGGKMEIPHADRTFIEKAAKSGMEEVDVSRVAMDRTSNPQVKEMASMMATDHESANAMLTTIASAKGVSVPAKDMDTTKKWAKKDSKDFDHDYLAKMVTDHEDAVKLFQKEATEGKDEETVAFARKVLPKLEHHLQMANDLKKSLK